MIVMVVVTRVPSVVPITTGGCAGMGVIWGDWEDPGEEEPPPPPARAAQV